MHYSHPKKKIFEWAPEKVGNDLDTWGKVIFLIKTFDLNRGAVSKRKKIIFYDEENNLNRTDGFKNTGMMFARRRKYCPSTRMVAVLL